MTKTEARVLYMVAVAIGMMLGTKSPEQALKIAEELFEDEYKKATA